MARLKKLKLSLNKRSLNLHFIREQVEFLKDQQIFQPRSKSRENNGIKEKFQSKKLYKADAADIKSHLSRWLCIVAEIDLSFQLKNWLKYYLHCSLLRVLKLGVKIERKVMYTDIFIGVFEFTINLII